MVAGDHYGADAAALGVGHSLLALLTRRVNHGHQAHEGEAVLVLQGQLPLRIHLAAGEGQNTQAILGKLLVGPGNGGAHLVGQGHHALGGEQPLGAGQQHVHGALGEQHGLAVHPVQGAHQLAVGIKGQLAQTGELTAYTVCIGLVHAAPVYQGDLGGVAHRSAAGHIHGGVTGQQADLHQQLLGRVAHVGILRLHQLAVRPDLLHGHLVLGQGTGLIRADHLYRAQAFHRLEFLDDGVLTSHFLGAHGQHDGHDAAQGLGDGGNRQSHGKEQGVQQAHAAAEQRQTEHQSADG